MATIDNLTLELNADSTKAIKAIDALSQSMASLKVNMPKGTAFNGTVKGLQSLRTELSKISTSAKGLEKIKALGDIAKGLSKIGENTLSAKKLQGTADGLTSISSAINSISYEGVAKIEKLSSALSKMPKLSDTKSALRSISSSASNLNTFLGSTKTSGTTDVVGTTGEAETQQATENTSKVISLFATLKMVGAKVHPVVQGITTALGFMGDTLKKIISPLTSVVKGIQHFVKSLARIAFYRFIRSILKSISAGLKEGIQNLALYSKAMNELDTHSANHVMSRYASEFLYFKNAVATAVIPVLRAMIPLIEQVINKVIDLINVIAQIGSAFFGGTFTKAKYFWVDYADSLDKANGRAKALHHQLAGFDELNNLTAPSGGSGGNDLLDPSQMFEEADISARILDKVNKIKEAIEKIKKLGKDIWDITKPIRDRVVEVFEWLKKLWDRVYPNLKKVWELIEKIWDKVGKPFAEGFIKGFIDGLFGEFDAEKADELIDKIGKISDKIGEASDKIKGWVDKLDEDKIRKFGETVGKILGNIAFYAPYLPIPLALLGQPKYWQDIDKITQKLEKFNEKLDKLKESVATFISSIIQLIIDWQTVCWDLGTAIGEAIAEFLKTKDIEQAWSRLTQNLESIFTTAKEIIGGDLDAIKQKLVDLVKDIPIIGVIVEYFSDKTGKNYNPSKASLSKNYNPSKATISGYASGGYIDNGDLFIANERGAEMVGSIGNQTAVANNDQITQAIATATYNAMSKALSENNGSVTFVVEGDGDQMYKIWQKKNREYERRTGLAY